LNSPIKSSGLFKFLSAKNEAGIAFGRATVMLAA
jgi:hypothetical protein